MSGLSVAGDSAGGNMAAVLAILAKQRGDLHIVHQSLYYPITDAGEETESYRQFYDGPYGTAAAIGLAVTSLRRAFDARSVA